LYRPGDNVYMHLPSASHISLPAFSSPLIPRFIPRYGIIIYPRSRCV
jgi:hypothetical protein